ncbi:MAG TPA: lipid A deacylase LpxR family protein [Phycisphaerae bacterium]|nr:lipid A deacylase LpxR family protein [Phycisphaerae bacterium]
MRARSAWVAAAMAALCGLSAGPPTARAAGTLQAPPLSLHPEDLPPALAQVPLLSDRPPEQYASKFTLYWDNDGGWAKPIDRHDKHYTSGVGASLAWRAPWVDALLDNVPSIADEFPKGATDHAMGFVGALTMYTPKHYVLTQPIPDDRPFAGYTYGGLFFQRANRQANVPVYEALEVDLGILGPSSLAQNAQEMVHHTFGYPYPRGWSNQINDEAEFAIKYDRRWRLDAWTPPADWQPWAPRVQVLPQVGLTAGTVLDEAHAGAIFRAGWNMPDDFGPGNLAMPGDFTYRPASPDDPFTWRDIFRKQSFFLFARPYGELVARNSLLEGDAFSDRDPVTVSPEHALFGVEYGLSHRFLKYFEFTYSWTTESPEFKGQDKWDTWASVRLSFEISW